MSLFLRKCSSTRKGSLASSLLLPLRRHTPSAAPEPCVRAGTCSFLRDRRTTHPRICRRLEFLLVCPNHGSAFLQNVKISSRLARLHPVRRSRIYFFACARNSADHAFVRSLSAGLSTPGMAGSGASAKVGRADQMSSILGFQRLEVGFFTNLELMGHAVAPFPSRLHELFAFLSISV